MIWLVLAINASLQWTDIGAKQALICQVPISQPCLSQLPINVRHQLPNTLSEFNQALGQKGAMVMPVDDIHISGLVIMAPLHVPHSVLVELSGELYAFSLEAQQEVTLWHELGHLEAAEFINRAQLTRQGAYQHEWLADCYVIWRSAREKQSLSIAWQQYHRRNLDVVNNVSAMSHWTVPILAQVLDRYSLEEIILFDSFDAFMRDVIPHLTVETQDTLDEFSSLIHRTFSTRTLLSLPNYMSWRKPAIRQYFEPTLVTVLGREQATMWLQQSMFTAVEPIATTPRL